MSYGEWFEQHADKHKKIVAKLISRGYTKEQIIEYFEFENMVKAESDFCPLYKDNKKCHDTGELNCYLCACPNFRFDDNGIEKVENYTKYSFCAIDSKDGRQGVYGDKIHQDCSKCTVPHHKEHVQKKFDLDWREIMRECNVIYM
ncbi:MAG: hypothetical protein WC272_10935 [Sulfurimonas sp.]|jgi:Zn-finger protein